MLWESVTVLLPWLARLLAPAARWYLARSFPALCLLAETMGW